LTGPGVHSGEAAGEAEGDFLSAPRALCFNISILWKNFAMMLLCRKRKANFCCFGIEFAWPASGFLHLMRGVQGAPMNRYPLNSSLL